MNNLKLISAVGGGFLGLLISGIYSGINTADHISTVIICVPIGLILGFCMGTVAIKKKKSYNSVPENQEATKESITESIPEVSVMEAIPEDSVTELNHAIKTDSIIEIHTEKADASGLDIQDTEEPGQNAVHECEPNTIDEQSPVAPSLPVTNSETHISIPQSSNTIFSWECVNTPRVSIPRQPDTYLDNLSAGKEKYQNSKDVLYFEIVSDEEVSLVGYSGFPHSVDIPIFVELDGRTYIVSSIGPKAFRNCITLATVKIPESIRYIGEEAFWGCFLLEVYISDRAHCKIERNAFKGKFISIT